MRLPDRGTSRPSRSLRVPLQLGSCGFTVSRVDDSSCPVSWQHHRNSSGNDDSESGESGENLSQTHSGESGESTDTMLDLLPRINQEHTCLAIPLGVW